MDIPDLIQKAKEHDPDAFNLIYRQYHPRMMGVCMNIVKEDRATVEDLVHDAFVLAFVSIGQLRDSARLGEWLTTIVRNVALKHVEQRNRLRLMPLSAVSEEDAAFIDTSSSPEADLNRKELFELVNRLPEGYSKILRLSVIEGFSHKEIADMLGIEPHSSSSQLSRAKRMLRRIITSMAVGIVVVLLIPFAWYYIRHRSGGIDGRKEETADVKSPEKAEPEAGPAEPETEESIDQLPEIPVQISVQSDYIAHRAETIVATDTDSVSIVPQTYIDEDVMTAEALPDSADVIAIDSVVNNVIQPQEFTADKVEKKQKRWQMLAAGSVGPALAQNIAKLMDIDISLLPEPDASSTMQSRVDTWEEYAEYLNVVSVPGGPVDTLSLAEIATHNTGTIEQEEHHDRPITVGLSLTKQLNDRWSLETGFQYSLLRSQFAMGRNGYTINSKQSAHYLGIPLHLSYTFMQYRRLSAYGSAGITMHIPVNGTLQHNYYVDWKKMYTKKEHITPSLQWQTGASIGLQYRLTPTIGLYVEPTLNWYIPTGSEIHTTWTEHPFVFTCPFGLRITF